ncbi:unnamed protein product [Darwinula stevensoni]|uniref:WAP domain-containing protein n=1 Tax=Darwinula stevensoni TaxID=69355 RepID=A0A7R8X708_9CRUS|nr:unnamed protein product [Darwinula stevensoni]CAG0888670.1 unnamed protein product [Darwinula stevensoni]
MRNSIGIASGRRCTVATGPSCLNLRIAIPIERVEIPKGESFGESGGPPHHPPPPASQEGPVLLRDPRRAPRRVGRQATRVPTAGTCPAINEKRCPRFAPRACTNDTDCTLGQVCCQGCDAKKVCVRADNNECPKTEDMQCSTVCSSDSDCQNGTLCCDECNRKICMPPTAGTCPAINEKRCPRFAPRACTNDTDCTLGQVCCQGCDAKKVCVRAVTTCNDTTCASGQTCAMVRPTCNRQSTTCYLKPTCLAAGKRCEYVRWRTMPEGSRVRAARGEELQCPAV